MQRLLRLVVLSAALVAGPAGAQDLTTSLRPQSRPAAAPASTAPAPAQPVAQDPVTQEPEQAAAALTAGPAPTIRPRPRTATAAPPVQEPAVRADQAPVAATSVVRPRARPAGMALPQQPAAMAAVLPAVRPLPRPEGLATAPPAQQASASTSAPVTKPERRGGLFGGLFGRRNQQEAPTPADGYVCGDRDIKGEELAPITSRVRGCGIEEPVRVTSVDGIRLSTPATIDCTTARALKTWINDAMRPAFGRPEVVELRIAASYICRPRNNVRGAKISEHGRGKAVDISGFILSNGRELSIAGDYNRTIRRAHKAACGIFGTTLGPGSDGYHEDHLHFDTSNLDRPYCR